MDFFACFLGYIVAFIFVELFKKCINSFKSSPKGKKRKNISVYHNLHNKSINNLFQSKGEYRVFDDDYPSCFLCGRNGQADPLERHHIFGGSNRKKSEQYKLTVLLCGSECHKNGKKAVHINEETAEQIHIYGQRKFEQEHPELNFMDVFGKNYK